MVGTRGVIWHQGEADNLKVTSQSDYSIRLSAVINQARTDFNSSLGWAISRVSRYKDNGVISTRNEVKNAQVNVKDNTSNSRWGAYYSDEITDRADDVHFNASGLSKLAELYDTGNFTGNTAGSNQGGDILSLTPVEFNNRPSLAVNVTRPTTTQITMSVSGVHSAYFWVSNEGRITDSPADKRTQSITVSNSGTDRWRCYVLDSKGNVAITQEVALPVQQAIIVGTGGECPRVFLEPFSDIISCNEISGWAFRQNSNSSKGRVDIYVDGILFNSVDANLSKPRTVSGITFPTEEGYIYNVPSNATWRDGVNHIVSVRLCNYPTDFASQLLNCPAGNDINITDKTGLIDVSSAGGTGSFVVNSLNANWNTGGTSWATVSPLSGSSGATAVTVTFNANTGSARNASLTVVDVNAGLLRTVDISQQGAGVGGGASICSNISTTNCGNASEGYTHSINVPTAGDYKFKITYASGESNATGSIIVDSDAAIQFSVGPSTGSWTPSSEVFVGTVQKTLSAGNHNIRIAGVNGVSGSNFAHNKLCAVSATSGGSNLSLSQTSWSPSSSANTQSVNVTSNISWSVSSSDGSWLTASPNSGSNNGSFTISATANGSTASRSGIITVSGSGVSSQTVSISQAGTGGGGSSICSNISTTNCGNASEGYTHTINIPTAGDYKFKITYASGESNATGSIIVDSDAAIQFSVGPSTGSWTPASEVFVGTVQKTLSAGNHNIRIAGVNGVSGSNFAHNKLCAVSATGGGNTLSLSQGSWLPSSSSASQSINVNSNISWSVSTNNPSWLTISTSSGSGNGSFSISVTANGSTSSRSGTITVSGSGIASQTVNVTQSGTGGGGTSVCSNISTVNCGNASEGHTHSLNITQAGNYKFKITYASGESNATGTITVDSDPATQFSVGPSTGSWTPSVEVLVGSVQKTLSVGNHNIRIAGVNGVSGSNFAHNKLCAVDAASNRIATFEEVNENLSVFPNPTTGKIKVIFSLQKDENVWFNLYDTQGKNLQLNDFEGKKGRNEVEFDLQNYSSGAYFIDLQYNQKREVRKVMKVN